LTKLGDARVRPLEGLKEDEKVEKVKHLRDVEYDLLKSMIH
jgi:hypothetical protein